MNQIWVLLRQKLPEDIVRYIFEQNVVACHMCCKRHLKYIITSVNAYSGPNKRKVKHISNLYFCSHECYNFI